MLAPCWVSKHFSLYVFPKAFLNKPDAPYILLYASQPYLMCPQQPEQCHTNMSMQVAAFNSCVMLHLTWHTKIKHRIKEVVRVIITCGIV